MNLVVCYDSHLCIYIYALKYESKKWNVFY